MSFARTLRTILIWGGLAAAGWFGYRYYFNRPPAITEYRTEPVTRTSLVHGVTASGELTALTLVQVGSQLSGTISMLNADFNTPVKQGQILATLDPATYKANLAQNEGELSNAQAELQLARLNATRKKQLLDKALAPVADYDKSVADLAQAEARVKIRNAALDKSKVDLDRCTIYSPIDGMVISRKVDVGQTVAASLNAPVIFEIAKDLASMEIHASVAEADIGGVENGQEVTFRVYAYPERTFTGVVKQVRNAPTTVENVVNYDTVIDVENKDLKLKPGMTADVTIVLAKRDMALAMPNGALRFKPDTEANPQAPGANSGPPPGGRGGGGGGGGSGRREGGGGGRGDGGERRRDDGANATRTVYVIDKPGTSSVEAVLKAVTVQTGITNGTRTEVISGLEDGQQVVTGTIARDSAAAAAPGGSNPFGGGGGGFRR